MTGKKLNCLFLTSLGFNLIGLFESCLTSFLCVKGPVSLQVHKSHSSLDHIPPGSWKRSKKEAVSHKTAEKGGETNKWGRAGGKLISAMEQHIKGLK